MKTAAQATAKWQSGVASAGPAYTAGVQNSADWAAATAGAESAMVAGFQQAAADGRITRGIQSRGTAGWRSRTLAKAGNWQTGVQQGSSAYSQAYTAKLQPMIEAGLSAISSMPRGGYAANKARLNAYLDAVHTAAQNL